jgi:serine phosphatase RsbU (regulator of sigma subunit)
MKKSNKQDNEYKIDNFTLLFQDRNIEEIYGHYILKTDRKTLRFGLWLVSFMYASFVFLDWLVSPNHIQELATIRLCIVSPLLFVLILLIRQPFFNLHKRIAYLATAAMIFTGFGHFAMASLAQLPYAYLMGVTSLILFFAYTVVNIRFVYSLVCCNFLVLIFELYSIFLLNLQATQIIYESVFVLSINLIGILAGYTIENNKRQQFIKSYIIESQKDEMQQQNEELQVQSMQLEEQKKQIEHQKAEIELKSQNLSNSINYARKIQKALLPLQDRIEKNFAEMFVFFRPRDVVSGDFYWFARIAEKIIVVGADCTGHGVPGAFMSMIGISMLTQIVKEKGMTNPEEILSDLHTNIRVTLRQKHSDSRDGMEAAVCVFDKKTKILTYAGAMSPIYLCQNGTLEEIKADRYPIGGSQNEEFLEFTKHTFDVSQPTAFYVFSDGFKDQFGGTENKKFLNKRFREMLQEIQPLPMKEQEKIIGDRFDTWKGDNFQIDDVLVIGVRI